MNPSRFPCQIRSIKGRPIIVPDGTDFYIAATWPTEALPETFTLLTAELQLRVVGEVTGAVDEEPALVPDSGVPVQGIGVLLERLADDLWLLDVGFPLQVAAADGPHALNARLGEHLAVRFAGAPSVEALQLKP